ncbi:MAG: hypothetical protein AAFX08_01895 [Pseudomonadota bacterium]
MRQRSVFAMIASLAVSASVACAEEPAAGTSAQMGQIHASAPLDIVAPAAERPATTPIVAMIERDRNDRAVFRRLTRPSTLEATTPRRASGPDAWPRLPNKVVRQRSET